jgi:hypothetical protein
VATLGLRATGFGFAVLVAFFGAALAAAGLLGSDLLAAAGVLADSSLLAASLATFFAAVAVVLGFAPVPVVSAGAAFFAAGFLGAAAGGFTSSGFVIAKTPFY